MKRLFCSALLAAAALSASSARAASDGDFTACDGYEAPKGKSDGISKAGWLWGMAARSADIRRVSTPLLNDYGLGACDRALADPRLKAEYLFRRANLLQGKALHAIGAAQPELALQAIDESDRLGTTSEGPYFARSVGVGNMAVRAYALIALDRGDEARRAIDAVMAARQWSQSVQRLALALQAHMDRSVEGQTARLHSAIPLNPKLAHSLFWSEFVEGDYTGALDIYPALDFTQPNMRGSWSLDDEEILDAKLLEERSSVIGAAAYARLVLGQESEARAMIAEGLRIAQAVLTPPPPRADGKPPRQSAVKLFERRRPYALRAQRTLEHWQMAVAFRVDMSNQSLEAMQQRFVAEKLMELPILPDVLGRFASADPALKPEADRAIGEFRSALEAERLNLSKLDVGTLMGPLPRPETADTVPVLKPAGDGYFLSDSGLSRDQEGESDVWTIRYTHNVAPIAADEELAMLGAAQTAQRLGFDSLMILNTSSIVRTTTVNQMYGGGSSFNSGYEAQLRVRFVDAAALPSEEQPMAWRLITAQQVIDQLEARYKSGGPTIAF